MHVQEAGRPAQCPAGPGNPTRPSGTAWITKATRGPRALRLSVSYGGASRLPKKANHFALEGVEVPEPLPDGLEHDLIIDSPVFLDQKVPVPSSA